MNKKTMEEKKIIINVTRSGYSPDQIRYTMTVGELMAILEDFEEDTPIYFGNDMQSYGWYTYGGLTERDIYDNEALEMNFGEDVYE